MTEAQRITKYWMPVANMPQYLLAKKLCVKQWHSDIPRDDPTVVFLTMPCKTILTYSDGSRIWFFDDATWRVE